MESLTLEIYIMRKGGKYMYMCIYTYIHTHTYTHTHTHTHIYLSGGGHGNPFQYSYLENRHGQRSLAGCSLWGHRVRYNWPAKHTHACAQSLSRVWVFCNSMDCSSPGSSVHGDFLGKKTGVGYHFLLQRIFLAQGLNPYLLHWQVDFLALEKHLYPSLMLKWCK